MPGGAACPRAGVPWLAWWALSVPCLLPARQFPPSPCSCMHRGYCDPQYRSNVCRESALQGHNYGFPHSAKLMLGPNQPLPAGMVSPGLHS